MNASGSPIRCAFIPASPFDSRHSRTALPNPPARACSSTVTTLPVFLAAWRISSSSGLYEPRVHHGGGNAFCFEPVRGLEGRMDHGADGRDHEIASFPERLGLADLQGLELLVHGNADAGAPG